MNTNAAPTTRWRRQQKTIRLLEDDGFTVYVLATGPADLIAFGPRGSRLVKVAFDREPITERDRNDLLALPTDRSVAKEVWTWPARKRSPRIDRI